MKPLEFVHTQHNTPCFVYADQIIAVMYLPTTKSVALIGPGSTAIQVLGELAEVERVVTLAKNASTANGIKPAANPPSKGASDGISKRKRK